MQTFTGKEYLKIDIANNFGLDKKLFHERIEWFDSNKFRLKELVNEAEEPALFMAGMFAYEDMIQRKPTGYTVALDACSSGLQIMAAITGCRETAKNTGLVDPDVRPDVYTTGHEVMATMMDIGQYPRSVLKDAIMTYFYGSEARPKAAFGEGTKELDVFFQVMKIIAPAAFVLRNSLIELWQPNVLKHSWVLPDNFHVEIKTMVEVEEEVHVKQLGIVFNQKRKVNKGQEKGLHLAANTIHSIDAFVVREMNRRCNYNKDLVLSLLALPCTGQGLNRDVDHALSALINCYKQSKLLSVRCIDYIDTHNYGMLPEEMREELESILNGMLKYKPFHLLTVHDCFRCHPNYMNWVRLNYIKIFMQLADSDILQDIVSQIRGVPTVVNKVTNDLSKYIAKSNYMLS